MSLSECICDTPEPWESNTGKQTNVCKKCQGVIPIATEIGRLLTLTEGVIRKLTFRDENEREQFAKHLADTSEERARQQLLTWRANRST